MDYLEFEKIKDDNWQDKVKKELKTDDLESYFLDVNGKKVNPFVRKSADNELVVRKNNQWKIGCIMRMEDEVIFNRQLKELLNFGLNAPIIEIDRETIDFGKAFDGVKLDYILPIFQIKDKSCLDAVNSFLRTQEKKEVGLIVDFEMDKNETRDYFTFINSTSDNHITSVTASNKILDTMSTIRSLRSKQKDQHGLIVGHISPNNESEYHPLIEITTQCMACIIGGVDVVILPHDADDINLTRLAINVQHLAQLESQLDKVDDPLKGSYLIEQMTAAKV